MVTWEYATRRRNIFVNGRLGASSVHTSTYQGTGPFQFGARHDFVSFLHGGLDEIAFYVGTAFGEDVAKEHYEAWAGAPRPMHTAPAFAAVSVSYTPRFQFLKGI